MQIHLWEVVANVRVQIDWIYVVHAERSAGLRHKSSLILLVCARRLADVARPHTRKGHDVSVVICGDGRARCGALVRAIALEPPETDREQLHDLARVVLVGVRAGDVQAAIGIVREVLGHQRRVTYLVEDGAIRAEGVAHEDVVVHGPLLDVAELEVVQALLADDEDLRERKGGALAQLIVGAEHNCGPDHHLAVLGIVWHHERVAPRVVVAHPRLVPMPESRLGGHLTRRATDLL